jgi:hypothetical protein
MEHVVAIDAGDGFEVFVAAGADQGHGSGGSLGGGAGKTSERAIIAGFVAFRWPGGQSCVSSAANKAGRKIQ